MSYYDSDLKAVLAQFHSQPDTDTRKDILKKLSDNQLSRVVIQGVKCEFEREGLEDIALVMLGVISRTPGFNAHDVHEENGVAVKHEETNGEYEVVIKMEELDDVNGIVMIKSEEVLREAQCTNLTLMVLVRPPTWRGVALDMPLRPAISSQKGLAGVYEAAIRPLTWDSGNQTASNKSNTRGSTSRGLVPRLRQLVEERRIRRL
ncbi:uncharacterized protein J4E78_009491 [Alternaria triticimaculans]|uniref:uncharacterized protein n=1 Tax=Alternaria triticimaculans TaxID=297637 RepID=UPI0020C54FA2|nr:uncharacterized protein J4E78_009491 [Alternaria triticimaculans]KAI4644672.1 hypothetical protein J4E78_009491 [Alternaria triticimaculans]